MRIGVPMPFLNDEPLDPRYDPMRQWLANLKRIDVPTLMIQGGSDYCDEPSGSEEPDGYLRTYTRVVLEDVGNFPHREAPSQVATHVQIHLTAYGS